MTWLRKARRIDSNGEQFATEGAKPALTVNLDSHDATYDFVSVICDDDVQLLEIIERTNGTTSGVALHFAVGPEHNVVVLHLPWSRARFYTEVEAYQRHSFGGEEDDTA